MSIASDARWLLYQWPGLRESEVARLLGVPWANVRGAGQRLLLPSRERPRCLPPEVVEGAPLETVQAAAKRARATPTSPIKVPFTAEIGVAAEALNVSPQHFVELAMRAWLSLTVEQRAQWAEHCRIQDQSEKKMQ